MKLRSVIPVPLRQLLKRWIYRRSAYISQAGQDLWVFGEAFNEKRDGYFVDLGAHIGICISNTYLLERKYNWRGICVDADPDTFVKLKQNRRAVCVHACLDDKERVVNFVKADFTSGIVTPNTDTKNPEARNVVQLRTWTLEKLLEKQGAPAQIDYMSVDIEGAEERVLANFNFSKYLVKCMTIERPSMRLKNILQANGFVLVREVPAFECFYVHRDYVNEYSRNLTNFYEKNYFAVRWR